MGGIWQATSNFTKGELDPRLVGRVDLEAYYQGVKEATNVLSIPQGGLKKRGGMRYIGEAFGDGRLESFSFSTEQNYLIVFTDLKMQIYKDGIIQTNINGSGFNYLAVPWTLAQIKEFDYIQSADSIIITHPNVAPQLIQRSSDTDWSIAAVPVTNTPQFDFNDAGSPATTPEIQVVTFTNDTNGDRFRLSLDGILTEDIAYSKDNTASTADNIRIALQDLPNTGADGISVVGAPSSYTVTFAGDSADDYLPMVGVVVYSKSVDFEISTSTIQSGASRSEDSWSVLRGWPRTCTFHEARLWFGGSLSLPSTVWGSKTNDPFNFDAGRGRDDEGITATLATDQVNAVTGIISNRALQIFTTGAEFYIPVSPITPEKVAVKPQTNLGSKRVRPVTIDGVTLFLQRTGKSLFQFQFLNDFQSNESRSVSLLAPHLINDPIKMAVSQGTSTTDASYVYLVNTDGVMTVFNTQSLEGVQSFTRWLTTGNVKSVAVVDNTLNTLTSREIGGATVYYIEVEDESLNTDSSLYQTVNSDTVTGLGHLEGETVKVVADGAVMLDEIVVGGQITMVRTAVNVEVGLEYQPRVETMPLNMGLNNGPNAAQKKRIMRCAVQVFESVGVLVNDQRLADKTIGLNQFDAPEPETGFKRIYLHGWSLEASVVITQTTPMPFTLLALDLEVKV
ncbi:hypothetical protein N9878_00910 [bacterium]|nr:hypothetical protein [bacterium]